ncbi:hypothetical protein X801_04110, partial [Opisthorchis viverrini]
MKSERQVTGLCCTYLIIFDQDEMLGPLFLRDWLFLFNRHYEATGFCLLTSSKFPNEFCRMDQTERNRIGFFLSAKFNTAFILTPRKAHFRAFTGSKKELLKLSPAFIYPVKRAVFLGIPKELVVTEFIVSSHETTNPFNSLVAFSPYHRKDAKDGSKNSQIGVSHAGVIVFRNNASSFQLP